MRYLVVSDLHGEINSFSSLLKERGWSIVLKNNKYVLQHPEEKLLFLGDATDRGKWGLQLCYLLLSSHVNEGSVIYVMGNHEEKLKRYLYNFKLSMTNGFDKTFEKISNPNYFWMTTYIKAYLDTLPYWYKEKSFIGVHAFWKNPNPGMSLSVYGPTKKHVEELPGQLPERIKWWEDWNEDYWVLFGHYHAYGELTNLNKKYVCLDNHDGNMFSYAIMDSEKGLISYEPKYETSLYSCEIHQWFYNV